MLAEVAYARARKMGLKEYHNQMQRQGNPFLPVLEDDEFPFLEEEELPRGYRPGEIVI